MNSGERLSPGPGPTQSREAFKLLELYQDAHTELILLETTGGLTTLIEAQLEEILRLESVMLRGHGITTDELRMHAFVGKRRFNNILVNMKIGNSSMEMPASAYTIPRTPAAPSRRLRQPKLF